MRLSNVSTWNVDKHDLIYTDSLWINTLQRTLFDIGFKHINQVNYSEAGMQGIDYVSLDINEDFIAEWDAVANKT